MTLSWMVRIITMYWPMFLRGAGTTLLIAIISTIIGSLIGLLVGVIRTIPMPERGFRRFLKKFVDALLVVYIELFRGTPMMVQAMVVFYGGALALGMDLNRLAAAFLIVSINTGAYMSEIVRGGIISIDKGQFEAAHAIGMNHRQTMVNIVLPQVIRNILPATGNEFVINIKDTSVLSVISVSELFFATKTVAGNNFRYFEAFFVASVLYLVMTLTVTQILRYFERRIEGPDSYIMLGNQMQLETPEEMLRRKATANQ
jgi:putative lysine transport system permease protein